jgi:threonine dehydratase
MRNMGTTPSTETPPCTNLAAIEAALPRIRAALPITPLTHSPTLSELTGREIFVKWENRHRTGSFKERGAVNFVALHGAESKNGVCAASAGNHALALSYHAARAGIPCHIVMPVSAPLVKVQATRKTGAEVILHGNTFDEAYAFGVALAAEKGYAYCPAFDHPSVIAGQGTAGLEIMEQLADFDSVIVPIGGGGLISGISTAIKSKRPDIFFLGVQSEWVVTARAKKLDPAAPQPLIPPTSIADGIAVKTIGKLTAPIIAQNVDQVVTVSENEIADAIMRLLELERTVVEGAGAAGIAALLAGYLPAKYKRTAVVVCGSNIDTSVLSRLIERDMAQRNRLLRLLVSVPDRPGSLHATTGIVARLGANVLQVYHDRSSTSLPGNVDIAFVLEIRDQPHKQSVIAGIRETGLEVKEIEH